MAMVSAASVLAADPKVAVQLKLGVNMLGGTRQEYVTDALKGKHPISDDVKSNKTGFNGGIGANVLWDMGSVVVGPALEFNYAKADFKEASADEAPSTTFKTTLVSSYGLGFYALVGLGTDIVPVGLLPYIKLGLAGQSFKQGYKELNGGTVEFSNDPKSKWKWGFSFGVGVKKNVGPVDLSLDYTYAGFGDLKNSFKDKGGDSIDLNFNKIASHRITLGVGTSF